MGRWRERPHPPHFQLTVTNFPFSRDMFRPSVPFRSARILRALPAVAALLLLAGCWLDGPQSTFHVKGPVARTQLDLFMVTVYVTAVIFAVVGGAFLGLLALTWWRSRNTAPPDALPPTDAEGIEPQGAPPASPDHFKVD